MCCTLVMYSSENICLLHWTVLNETIFAIAAVTNKIVIIADTTNAYQQSPPPTKPCFLEIDEAYCSWYKKKFEKDIDPQAFIIPLGHALQGHLEAGALWEKIIVEILETIFAFKIHYA